MERILSNWIAEKVLFWIAWHLPKRLVAWCAYRTGWYAVQGKYSNTIISEIPFMEVMDRWEKSF